MSTQLQNPVDRAKMNGKPVVVAPVRTVINFESGFKDKLLCDGPTFSAGTSCAYTCSYCYVPAIMAKNANVVDAKKQGHTHESVVIRRKNAVEIVRKQLTDSKGNPKFTDPNDQRVIYASPLVDVAANMELVRETIEICKLILELTPWHIRLLSKSNLLPKIAQALEVAAPIGDWTGGAHWMKRVIYGVSTGTLDDKLARPLSRIVRLCQNASNRSIGSRTTATGRSAWFVPACPVCELASMSRSRARCHKRSAWTVANMSGRK